MGNKLTRHHFVTNKSNSESNQPNDEEWVQIEEINKTHLNSTITLNSNILISKISSAPKADYIQIKNLGQGAFAKVCLVKNKITGSERAMKVISKKNNKEGVTLKLNLTLRAGKKTNYFFQLYGRLMKE